jgi:hypothetical protein
MFGGAGELEKICARHLTDNNNVTAEFLQLIADINRIGMLQSPENGTANT